MRNTLRIVSVWLDEYKDVFYAINPDMTSIQYGDVSERLQLREKVLFVLWTIKGLCVVPLANQVKYDPGLLSFLSVTSFEAPSELFHDHPNNI